MCSPLLADLVNGVWQVVEDNLCQGLQGIGPGKALAIDQRHAAVGIGNV